MTKSFLVTLLALCFVLSIFGIFSTPHLSTQTTATSEPTATSDPTATSEPTATSYGLDQP